MSLATSFSKSGARHAVGARYPRVEASLVRSAPSRGCDAAANDEHRQNEESDGQCEEQGQAIADEGAGGLEPAEHATHDDERHHRTRGVLVVVLPPPRHDAASGRDKLALSIGASPTARRQGGQANGPAPRGAGPGRAENE